MRLVLVTPETTLLDAEITGVQVPLFDGSAGIRPGHAAMVGRLGAGKLSASLATADDTGRTEVTYFVDSGFIQIKDGVVSLLTQRAMTLDAIDTEAAREELAAARGSQAAGDEAIDRRLAQQDRARRMLALARSAN